MGKKDLAQRGTDCEGQLLSAVAVCMTVTRVNLAGLKETEKCGHTGGNGSCPPPLRLNLTTGKTELHLLMPPCA